MHISKAFFLTSGSYPEYSGCGPVFFQLPTKFFADNEFRSDYMLKKI